MNIEPGKLFVLDNRCILVYSVEDDRVRFIEYNKDTPLERTYKFWSIQLLKVMLEAKCNQLSKPLQQVNQLREVNSHGLWNVNQFCIRRG